MCQCTLWFLIWFLCTSWGELHCSPGGAAQAQEENCATNDGLKLWGALKSTKPSMRLQSVAHRRPNCNKKDKSLPHEPWNWGPQPTPSETEARLQRGPWKKIWPPCVSNQSSKWTQEESRDQGSMLAGITWFHRPRPPTGTLWGRTGSLSTILPLSQKVL